ncbi:hypothetical protein tinsulaeT_10750 [Thalassotalea insulae]|uniref:DUF2141 domain-containing protein n=1 Tax=Thalassotalea insulae TaxID=2056778 RepID=A0ABQ6GST1_9GAMM|nr:DUF2141 domain-containing protein [Thalassotalea insulae]GLX77735.1 hypothetical protein tinsulaeT_10750 [Thalassotalea insulae]
MKTPITLFITILLTLFIAMPLFAKEVSVNILNIDDKKAGNIIVMLFAEEGFPQKHDKAIKTHIKKATTNQMTFVFEQVPEEFAVKVLHDEDESGEVTKNWTGIIPSEGLGFSNGAKLSFGPPDFDEAKLLKSNIEDSLAIQIIYP